MSIPADSVDAGEASAMVEAAMNDPAALEALDLTVYTRHLADRGDLTAEKAGFRVLRCSSISCRARWASAPLACVT